MCIKRSKRQKEKNIFLNQNEMNKDEKDLQESDIERRSSIQMTTILKELNQQKGMEQMLRIIILKSFPEIKKDLIFCILFGWWLHNYTQLSKCIKPNI